MKEKWQFAFSWFAIFFVTILLKYLKKVEHRMAGLLYKPTLGDLGDRVSGIFGYNNLTVNLLSEDEATSKESFTEKPRPKPDPLMRFMHAFMCMINYALSLLLMLVAMTYNPNLFLALCFGFSFFFSFSFLLVYFLFLCMVDTELEVTFSSLIMMLKIE